MTETLKVKDWLIKHFAYPWYLKKHEPTLISLVSETLLEAFPPEGYDVSTGKLIVDSRDPKKDGQNKEFSHTLTSFIWTFLGLPDRLDENKKITAKQGLKNLLGGWDWEKDTPTSKKVLQVLGMVFLIKPVIFPVFKTVAAIFKVAVNIVKLVTELLIPIAAEATGLAMSKLIIKYHDDTDGNGHIGSTKHYARNDRARKILCGLGIITLGLLHYPLRIMTIVGRAFTSPAKSSQMANAAGNELGGVRGKVVGAVGYVSSLAITAITWGITLPFVISAIPAAAITAISQAPVIGPAFLAIKSALIAVGNVLGPIFAPMFSKASVWIGSSIPSAAVSVGSALGTLAAAVTSVGSQIVDAARDFWRTAWREGGIFYRKRAEKPQGQGSAQTDPLPGSGEEAKPSQKNTATNALTPGPASIAHEADLPPLATPASREGSSREGARDQANSSDSGSNEPTWSSSHPSKQGMMGGLYNFYSETTETSRKVTSAVGAGGVPSFGMTPAPEKNQ